MNLLIENLNSALLSKIDLNAIKTLHGEFTKEDIEVTFIYDLSGTGDVEPEEEILPPQTGFEAIEYYSIMAIKYVIAMLLIVVSKKKLFN